MDRRSRSLRAVSATAIAGVLTLCGCDVDGIPIRDESNYAGAQAGVNSRTGTILLRDAYLAKPAGGAYEVGATAKLMFTVLNESRDPAALVDIESPAVREVRLRWDQACDGVAEPVAEIPIPFDEESSLDIPEFRTGYYAELIGFRQKMLENTTIPVTFRFRDAPPLNVELRAVPVPTGDDRDVCSTATVSGTSPTP